MKAEAKREQEREVMLKNELRKLREEDIRKLRERQKRLESQKKVQILMKEKEHEEIIKFTKAQEDSIIKNNM